MAGEVGGAAVEEIGGEAAVEGFGGIGGEGDGAVSEAGAAIVRGAAGEDGVDALAVVGGDVLDVGDVLQASFDLEAADAGIHQGLEVCGAVHVAEREEVALLLEHMPFLVEEVEG